MDLIEIIIDIFDSPRLAVSLSIVSLLATWWVNHYQTKLNKLQIKELTKEPVPDLMAEIEKNDKSYKFVVRNIGNAPAFDITVECEYFNSIFCELDIFPYQRLDVSQSMSTLLVRCLGSGVPSKLQFVFQWKDDNCKIYKKHCWCTW